MAGESTKLGEAVIQVRVDDTGVGPGFATAVQQAEQATKSVNGLGASFLSLRQSVNVGLAAFVGIMAAAQRLSEILNKLAKGTKELGREFAESVVSGGGDAAKKLNAINAAYDEQEKKLERLTSATNIFSIVWDRAKLAITEGELGTGATEERMRALAEERARLEKKVLQDAEIAKKEAEDKAMAETLQKQRDAMDRLAIEEEQKRVDREAKREEEEAKRKKDLEDFYRDMERMEYEAAERAAKHREELMKAEERLVRGIREAAASLFNTSEITNSIELIGQKLDAIARNTKSRM